MTVETEHVVKTRKAFKKPKFKLLDNAVWVWFCQERRKGTPLSGPFVKEKAIQLNKKLGGDETEFTAREGWLWRYSVTALGKLLFQAKSFQPMMMLLKSLLKSSKIICIRKLTL